MSENLPALLGTVTEDNFPVLVKRERELLRQARALFDSGFYDHALLNLWNAAVSNLRRRAEAYGSDIFLSTVKDEGGRKKYDVDGETLAERWSGVDDLVLIAGATRLGLLNKKAGKALEMINWMRNHASPAHESDSSVELEDVVALALLLQKNLFESPLPDPGHSPSSLFEPVRSQPLNDESVGILCDQIRGMRLSDVRVAFGFMLDLLGNGEEPAYSNVIKLFPSVWQRASEELKKTAGLRYHSLTIKPESDESVDGKAKDRLLYFLTSVEGIKYIPDAARAIIYRRAARQLGVAKDTSYGWKDEMVAARSLAQFGPYVPGITFEEVYQEILAVWCGNYWGRSSAYATLTPFIDALTTDQVREVGRLFKENERVRSELFQARPKSQATSLLQDLKDKLVLEAHKSEIDATIIDINQL